MSSGKKPPLRVVLEEDTSSFAGDGPSPFFLPKICTSSQENIDSLSLSESNPKISSASHTDQAYLDDNGIPALFSTLQTLLLRSKPRNPELFLRNILDQQIAQEVAKVEKSKSSEKKIKLFLDSLDTHFNPIFLDDSTFGIDIGGTLSKLVFYDPKDEASVDEKNDFAIKALFRTKSLSFGSLGFRDEELTLVIRGARIHFIHFPTVEMNHIISYLSQEKKYLVGKCAGATGGGAYKYNDTFSSRLSVRLHKYDELQCLLTGINFLLQNVRDECFYFEETNFQESSIKRPYLLRGDIYPYLLVNIGSGVSILKVDDEVNYQRVSGSAMGGSTYLGLCKLLTRIQKFSEVLDLSRKGDSRNLDMLVKDIYGGDYVNKRFTLKGDVVASYFGKIAMKSEPLTNVSDADIACSLLNMIGNNIAQLAYLCAMRHAITRILFVGSFLRHNFTSMGSLCYAINYWSGGVMKGLFAKHEGYAASLGALLLHQLSLSKDHHNI